MGDRVDQLEELMLSGVRFEDELIGLARIWIPPHKRMRDGNVQNVDGYWKNIDTNISVDEQLSPIERAAYRGKIRGGGTRKRDVPVYKGRGGAYHADKNPTPRRQVTGRKETSVVEKAPRERYTSKTKGHFGRAEETAENAAFEQQMKETRQALQDSSFDFDTDDDRRWTWTWEDKNNKIEVKIGQGEGAPIYVKHQRVTATKRLGRRVGVGSPDPEVGQNKFDSAEELLKYLRRLRETGMKVAEAERRKKRGILDIDSK
jgi:hypothetical protein